MAPHDLRRTCARLCHAAGGELEQIQFLLGHVSIQTTERYLGCKQRIRSAVNERIDIDSPGMILFCRVAGLPTIHSRHRRNPVNKSSICTKNCNPVHLRPVRHRPAGTRCSPSKKFSMNTTSCVRLGRFRLHHHSQPLAVRSKIEVRAAEIGPPQARLQPWCDAARQPDVDLV